MIELRNLSWTRRLNNISLAARAGEVVGLGGLDGQGQRELLLAMFGVLSGVSGEILIDGESRPSPARAAKGSEIGMALIPEDRKTEGLMLAMSVGAQSDLRRPRPMSRGGVIDRPGEARAIDEMFAMLAIRAASPQSRSARFQAAISRRSSSPNG